MKPDISYWIPAQGAIIPVRPADKKKFTLQELRRFVGGPIEIATTLRDGRFLICNEEGKINPAKTALINVVATIMYQALHGPIDVIVGDCLLVRPEEID